MKILFDTNILLDLLLMRKPYYDSVVQLVSLVETRIIEGWLCPNTVSMVHYLLSEALDEEQATGHLATLLNMYQVSGVNQETLNQANKGGYSDYNYALTYQSALQAGVDAILTRNQEQYSEKNLPILTPDKLLALLNSLEN
ncbi:MAG: PIN domain-containing protein, partial [Balneolaceae bacterium]